ncbi:hypothetical protein B0H63DRAFT_480910 [Podospora didyma]|uniref:Uncharacterized protein n=1 Tax=Podospora didyma TaxID=330526 RepID=A0AAE0N988_9PEZI|nr:hypothetical protein B0H63DRAFT_480910 [Podospora didyma]
MLSELPESGRLGTAVGRQFARMILWAWWSSGALACSNVLKSRVHLINSCQTWHWESRHRQPRQDWLLIHARPYFLSQRPRGLPFSGMIQRRPSQQLGLSSLDSR